MFQFKAFAKRSRLSVTLISIHPVSDDHVQMSAAFTLPGAKGSATIVFDWDEEVLISTIVNSSNAHKFEILQQGNAPDGMIFGLGSVNLKPFLTQVKSLLVSNSIMQIDYSNLAALSDVADVFSGCEPYQFAF